MSRQINFCSDRKKSFHTKLDAMIQILNIKSYMFIYNHEREIYHKSNILHLNND